ncbi:MAG: hypothetical protein QG602_2410 [Verrucomicrobiota bacterium]|nr:hypothetical protein [Verrucomicrobiota bacterium]
MIPRNRQDKQGVGHDFQKEITPDFERQRFDDESLALWQDSLRALDSGEGELIALMLDRLGGLFDWLTQRQDPEYVIIRTWVLCYFCRPQIIHYETIGSFAKRMGKTAQGITHHIREFQALFPGVRFPMRPSGINRKPNANQNGRRYQQVVKAGGSEFHHTLDRYQAEVTRVCA